MEEGDFFWFGFSMPNAVGETALICILKVWLETMRLDCAVSPTYGLAQIRPSPNLSPPGKGIKKGQPVGCP